MCVVGSANLDVVAHAPRIPRPGETLLGTALHEFAGGKGINQAVAAARSGAITCFVGALGTDEPGDRLRQVLAHDGITPLVRTTATPTGRAIITVDTNAENTIVVIPGANAEVRDITLPPASVVLAQLEIPLETVTAAFTAAQARGGTTVLNPAPATELPTGLLASCDYLIPNEHEITLVGGPSAALEAGCRAVIITLGANGVDIVTPDGTEHVDPFPVTAVDTTGAGDAFCGAFSARIAAGDDLHRAVRWAAAAGALATTVPGAVPSQPTAAAVRKLIDAG